MGNMIFNKRVMEGDPPKSEFKYDFDKYSDDKYISEDKQFQYERRIFPQHMYGGPKGLGDPHHRDLSKMEEDPMIPQRMRDITRTQLCLDEVKDFGECVKQSGFMIWYYCRDARDKMTSCQKEWFERPGFRESVIEEYLNERSHFRETGIKTKRYQRGGFIKRDLEADPPLDKNGRYRPQKPIGWDESYPDGPPSWANYTYPNP